MTGVSVGQESRILSAPFALPDPIAPADALDIYDERANVDTARTILEAPAEYSPVVVELARTILAPARTLVEPTRPEPFRPAGRFEDPPSRPDRGRAMAGPVARAAGRPSRRNGTGAEWHAVNRPDCRAEQRASA